MTDSLSTIRHLNDEMIEKRANNTEDVYRSPNGDVWQLVQKTPTSKPVIRHTSNVSSGGAVRDMSVDEFLATNGTSPEHNALRLLLNKTQAT